MDKAGHRPFYYNNLPFSLALARRVGFDLTRTQENELLHDLIQ
jgi:hypothetical protein